MRRSQQFERLSHHTENLTTDEKCSNGAVLTTSSGSPYRFTKGKEQEYSAHYVMVLLQHLMQIGETKLLKDTSSSQVFKYTKRRSVRLQLYMVVMCRSIKVEDFLKQQ